MIGRRPIYWRVASTNNLDWGGISVEFNFAGLKLYADW